MRVFPGGDGNFQTGMKKVRAAIAKDPLIGVHLKVATVHTIRSRIKGLTGKEKTELVSRRGEVAGAAKAGRRVPSAPRVRPASASAPIRPRDIGALAFKPPLSATHLLGQQLLGDVSVRPSDSAIIPAPLWANEKRPPWLDGTPLDPASGFHQAGYYPTWFLPSGGSYAYENLTPDLVRDGTGTGNATFNLTNWYANVAAGDGHISVEVNGVPIPEIAALTCSQAGCSSPQPQMLWLFDDIMLPFGSRTSGEQAFDVVGWTPAWTWPGDVFSAPLLNLFSTGSSTPNPVFPALGLQHPPNWVANPNDPSSSSASPSNRRYTTLSMLAFPGPPIGCVTTDMNQQPDATGCAQYWTPAAAGGAWPPGTAYPFPGSPSFQRMTKSGTTWEPGSWIQDPNSGAILALMPGCASPRTGVVLPGASPDASGTFKVIAATNATPTGKGCRCARLNAVSVVARLDPAGQYSSGSPSFVVERVLDFTSCKTSGCRPTKKDCAFGAGDNPGHFIDTSAFVSDDGDVYVLGVGGLPGDVFLGRAPAPGYFDDFEVWCGPDSGQGFQPWVAGMVDGPMPIISGGSVVNASLAKLRIQGKPIWIMRHDSAAAQSDPAIYYRYFLGEVPAPTQESTWSGAWPLVTTSEFNSLFGVIHQNAGTDGLLGPETPAGKAAGGGHLYMPKILAGFTQDVSGGDSKGPLDLVIYWTVSTLLPYYCHIVRSTLVP